MLSEMLWGEMAGYLALISVLASGFAAFRTQSTGDTIASSGWFSLGAASMSMVLAVICAAIWTRLCG